MSSLNRTVKYLHIDFAGSFMAQRKAADIPGGPWSPE